MRASTRLYQKGSRLEAYNPMNSHQVGIPRAVLARAITAVIAGSHQCRMTNSRAESQLSGAHQLRQTDSLTSRDTGATKPERFDSSTTVINGMSGRHHTCQAAGKTASRWTWYQSILASELCLKLPDPSPPPHSVGWRRRWRGQRPTIQREWQPEPTSNSTWWHGGKNTQSAVAQGQPSAEGRGAQRGAHTCQGGMRDKSCGANTKGYRPTRQNKRAAAAIRSGQRRRDLSGAPVGYGRLGAAPKRPQAARPNT